MFCAACGSESSGRAKFCKRCGEARVAEEEEYAPKVEAQPYVKPPLVGNSLALQPDSSTIERSFHWGYSLLLTFLTVGFFNCLNLYAQSRFVANEEKQNNSNLNAFTWIAIAAFPLLLFKIGILAVIPMGLVNFYMADAVDAMFIRRNAPYRLNRVLLILVPVIYLQSQFNKLAEIDATCEPAAETPPPTQEAADKQTPGTSAYLPEPKTARQDSSANSIVN